MLLTKLCCDGCGRKPSLVEWMKAEVFTADGYAEWRHPGLAFKEAGVPMIYDNRDKVARLFEALFGRPQPIEMGFLCPQCQAWVEQELPGLASLDDRQTGQVARQQYQG